MPVGHEPDRIHKSFRAFCFRAERGILTGECNARIRVKAFEGLHLPDLLHAGSVGDLLGVFDINIFSDIRDICIETA